MIPTFMTTSSKSLQNKLSKLMLAGAVVDPITVLLVEDSRTVRIQLRHHLELLEQVELVEAATLAEAKQTLQERHSEFFCAIVDLTLPDADGLQSVELVNSFGVPIIVLTGSMDTELRKAVLGFHVIDYMFKSGTAAIESIAYLVGRLRQNQQTRIMVVDDSPTFRQHVRTLLQRYRYQVVEALDGEDALAKLAADPEIALVLTDYEMPRMNGLELVKHIRRTYRQEDLPIIALSDTSKPELSAAMLKTGANDFLSKRFQVEEFYCRLVLNTNMVHYVRELRQIANCDYLTRLHNRRHMFELAEPLYKRVQESGGALAVAMVDADHFKRVNDQHGHLAGDEALRRIAQILRQNMGPEDIAARYGGEEFICVVRLSDPKDAYERFDQLRQELAAINMVWQDLPVALTASIGLTTEPGTSLTAMIDLADQALYQAKAAGRNCVVELP